MPTESRSADNGGSHNRRGNNDGSLNDDRSLDDYAVWSAKAAKIAMQSGAATSLGPSINACERNQRSQYSDRKKSSAHRWVSSCGCCPPRQIVARPTPSAVTAINIRRGFSSRRLAALDLSGLHAACQSRRGPQKCAKLGGSTLLLAFFQSENSALRARIDYTGFRLSCSTA
jgi:hypothetical protein